MANPFSTAFKSFWYTMTTYDRHSSFDSPQRTGRHVPLRDHRSGMLTGIATASDSRPDISNPYLDDTAAASSATRYEGHGASTPNRSYSPGLRSSVAKSATADGFELQAPGDVQMQSFSDGLPPPPPVQHSWARIDSWASENYFELYDQLGEGCTINDLNDLEHQLDCSLPQDVRDSLMVHDGQERGGTPTGIIFSGMLMDAEEIVQEWEVWRRVNEQYLLDATSNHPPPPSSAHDNGEGDSSSRLRPPSSGGSNPDHWQENLLQKQDCIPPNSIRKAYAHSGWIPLVRDWGGNNLAVDLAPGPAGSWGQIILFGRDYDTKYVVARSWAAFLALVADDLNSGKWYVDEETNELKLREFKETRIEPSYFNILRWRMDQKSGRGATTNKRKSMAPLSKPDSPLGSRSASPYRNPADAASTDARGRSVQRLKASSPLASPGARNFGKPLPLSRVTEEMVTPILPDAQIEPSTLVEAQSPQSSHDGDKSSTTVTSSPVAHSRPDLVKDKENEPPEVNAKQSKVVDGIMKTIEI